MKIKTSELTGVALDWAVAKATGAELVEHQGDDLRVEICHGLAAHWSPSTSWSQCGPLIDRFRPDLMTGRNDGLVAYLNNDASSQEPLIEGHGGTYLVAACRSIVVYALGDTVDVPEELLL